MFGKQNTKKTQATHLPSEKTSPSQKPDKNLPEQYHQAVEQFIVPIDTTNNLLPILRRRKVLALAIFMLGFGSSLVTIENIAPIYEAHALLSFENSTSPFVKRQIGLLQTPEFIKTLMMNTELSPEENARFKSFSFGQFEQANTTSAQQFSATLSAQTSSDNSSNIAPKRLRLSITPDTETIDISYSGHNAQTAAAILNHVLEAYIDKTNSEALESSSAEANKNSKVTPQKQEPVKQTETPESYTQAKNNYITIKSQLSGFIGKDGRFNLHDNETAIEQLHSDTLDALLETLRADTYDLETLSVRYGEKHPKIINARAKIETVKGLIKQERESLLANLIEDYIQAKTVYEALESSNSAAQASSHDAANSLSKTSVVQLIQPAQIPDKPVFPNKTRFLGLSALLSLLLSLLIPVVIERNRKTFLNGKQLSAAFGLPCYALIPETKNDDNKALCDYVLDHPADALTEAVRSLRLNIKLDAYHTKNENKVVLFTSSKEDEGKSSLCTWLGRLTAKSGEKVLLIDANLRTPSLHKALNGKNTTSLIEYLTGKASFDEIIDTTDPSGLNVIYGRTVPNSALDLLSTDKMKDMIETARTAYDLIIIDAPSCLANADVRALQPCADLLLYLVSWNKTKRDVIHRGLSQFVTFPYARIGLVLSNIDLKKHIAFGYGEVICEEYA